MRRFLLLSILTVCFAASQNSLGAELVGLRGIELGPDERVWGFEIKLKEGRIAALHKIPQGWKITAENYGEAGDYKDGGGEIEASAGIGHDALSAAELPVLGDFLLIDESAIHHAKAELTGFLKISGPKGNRKLRLGSEHFLRTEVKKEPNQTPEPMPLKRHGSS